MVRVAAAVVRQDWKLHRLYDTGNSKGCSEAGLEADIATFAGSLNPPSLLSPTSHPLSRAEREIWGVPATKTFPATKTTLFSACKIVSGPALQGLGTFRWEWLFPGGERARRIRGDSAENRWIMSSVHDQCGQLRSFLLVMVVIDSLSSSHNYLNACLIDPALSLMIWSEGNI